MSRSSELCVKVNSVPWGIRAAIQKTAAKDYQRYATRCLQEARVTADSRLKGFLVEMAQAWQRLAAERVTSVKSGQDRSISEPDRGDYRPNTP